jgi:hypothetical protein
MQVKCGKRSYMLELYPSEGPRETKELVEDKYHNQLDNLIEKFDSLKGLKDFDGL